MTCVTQYRRGVNRGFTLVEILMVVVILGIAAAAVVPQLSSRDDLKAAAAARVLMADLIYAQNRAISVQQTHFVAFDVAAKKYSVLTAWNPQVFVTHPINKTNYVTSFSTAATGPMKEMTLTSADFDAKAGLAFDSLGSPYSVATDGTTAPLVAAGQVKVTAGSHTLTVTVEPYTGEINVQ
jgi:prepilin-type N-terminal cleavage/methylation domain-containing protein